MTDKCIICGGVNDSSPSWQTFCLNCSKETWGAAVVASFIKLAQDCQDKVKVLEKRIEELERPF
jgi:uncharacterized protein YgfB (UPF0149 family)